jgi:hypothetical protein
MFLEDDDDKQDASDTVGGIGEGIADGSPSEVGHAIKEDAEQTKDDVEEAVGGEDGNNS